jgi:hypothetical protein
MLCRLRRDDRHTDDDDLSYCAIGVRCLYFIRAQVHFDPEQDAIDRVVVEDLSMAAGPRWMVKTCNLVLLNTTRAIIVISYR